MNSYRLNVTMVIQALIAVLFLVGADVQASETSRVAQTAVGNCNQNSLITSQTSKTINGKPSRDAAPTISTIGTPCVIIQINHKLNALENAQMQLLIAEHPTRVSMGPVLLGKRLGETTTSIWVDVANQSSYNVHGLRIDPATEQRDTLNAKKTQTYLTSSLPDAVISTGNLVLKGGESVRLLAATPSVIAKALASVPSNWCLFDVGDRATDNASEGYKEASLSEFEKLNKLPGSSGNYANFQTIPIVFTVRYSDIFEIIHEVPVSTYLRVASPDSTSVFYPSRRAFGALECHKR